jgi:translation initiation factor 1
MAIKDLQSLGGLVYSTEVGRTCPHCRQALAQCQCKQVTTRPAGDGWVRVQRETKGRGGKAVTLVKGLPLNDTDMAALAKQLKAACGSGGTVKEGVMEIQGDHVEKVLTWLTQQGHKVKKAGG